MVTKSDLDMHLDNDAPLPQAYTQTPDWGTRYQIRDYGTGQDWPSVVARTPRGFHADPYLYVDGHCRMRLDSLDGNAQFELSNEVGGDAHLIFTPEALLKFAPLVMWAARNVHAHGHVPGVPDETEDGSDPATETAGSRTRP